MNSNDDNKEDTNYLPRFVLDDSPNTVNRSEYLFAHIFNFWLNTTSTNVL